MKKELFIGAGVVGSALFGASLALKNPEYIDQNSASAGLKTSTPTTESIPASTPTSASLLTPEADGTFTVNISPTPEKTPTALSTPTSEASSTPTSTVLPEFNNPQSSSLENGTQILESISLNPGEKITTEESKTYFITGDIVLDSQNLFDQGVAGTEKTGLMVHIANEVKEIEAPYGAGVLVLDGNLQDSEINNRINESFDLGCVGGCDSITLKFFGGEFDGQSVVIENGGAFNSESIEDNQTTEIISTNEPTQTPEPTNTSLPEPSPTQTLEVLSTITSSPTNEPTQTPEIVEDEESKIEPAVSTSQPEESTPVAQEEEIELLTYSAIEAGSSEIVVGPALILGDVNIIYNTSTEPIQIYDSIPETGSVALITSSDSSVTVSAEWGADILKINTDINDPEVQSQITEIIKTKIENEGCDTSDGNGCSQGMLLTIVNSEGVSEQILINSDNLSELEGLLK